MLNRRTLVAALGLTPVIMAPAAASTIDPSILAEVRLPDDHVHLSIEMHEDGHLELVSNIGEGVEANMVEVSVHTPDREHVWSAIAPLPRGVAHTRLDFLIPREVPCQVSYSLYMDRTPEFSAWLGFDTIRSRMVS